MCVCVRACVRVRLSVVCVCTLVLCSDVTKTVPLDTKSKTKTVPRETTTKTKTVPLETKAKTKTVTLETKTKTVTLETKTKTKTIALETKTKTKTVALETKTKTKTVKKCVETVSRRDSVSRLPITDIGPRPRHQSSRALQIINPQDQEPHRLCRISLLGGPGLIYIRGPLP